MGSTDMVADTRFSRKSLFEFIDYVDKKNLVKHSAARNWRSAAKQLLSVLDDNEAVLADLRGINVDELISRFTNKKGRDMTPVTMKVYRTRFLTAITNFVSWAEDPVNFKPNVSSRAISKAAATKAQKTKTANESQRPLPADYPIASAKSASDSVIFPIPLADGRIVTVHNLPNNLCSKDAEKICAVIRALATSQEK